MSPMLMAVGTDVEEVGSVQAVGLGVGACAFLVAGARSAAFFLHWLPLGWLGCLLVGEPQELVLQGFLLGEKKLGYTDGVSADSVLPLQLLVLYHEQDLFVGDAHQMPRGGGGVMHQGPQVEDVVHGDLVGMVGKRISKLP